MQPLTDPRRPTTDWRSLARHAVAGLAVAVLSCASLAKFNLIPVEQDAALGAQAYPELLEGERTIASGKDHEMVQRVTQRLVAAANHFDPEISALFEWEVRLVDKPDMVNAWCLPGGKMAVFTGILPVAESEAGLAVVMGHEIAHATKRHGTRAMTRQLGATTIVNIAAILLFDEPDTQAMAAAIGTYAAAFGNLKFGRDAELEADATGLNYMAHAGYDPREATRFWGRMQSLSGGAAMPDWLSTHPSHGSRIEQIEELLPDALAIYAQSGGTK